MPDIYGLDLMYVVNIEIGLDWVSKNERMSNSVINNIFL